MDPAVPILGVSLRFLQAVRDSAAVLQSSAGPPRLHRPWESPPSTRQAGQRLTTEDVCFEIIKQQTATTQAVYAELLAAGEAPLGGPEDLGRATVFVSHAWKYAFADVISGIEAAEASGDVGEGSAFYWFDLFFNSQWNCAARPFEWWTSTFFTKVRAIGRTLLVLSPWNDPIPLTRAWCLFEIHATKATNSTLVITLPEEQTAAFEHQLATDFDSILAKLSAVDVHRAEAFSEADRRNIFKCVEEGVGFPELNAEVIALMRTWLLDRGRQSLARMECAREPAPLNLRLRLGWLCESFSLLHEAEELYTREYDLCTSAYGERHPSTLLALFAIGGVLKERGKWVEAEEAMTRALVASEEVNGSVHAQTLRIVHLLSYVIRQQGKHDESQGLLERAIQGRTQTLGDTHHETLRSCYDLACLHVSAGRHDEAEPLVRKTLAAQTKGLGPRHPNVLETTKLLANIHEERKEFDESARLLRTVLQGFQEVYGQKHSRTIWIEHCIAMLQYQSGPAHYVQAAATFRRVLALRQDNLGFDHRDTAATRGMLGVVLSTATATAGESVPLLRRAILALEVGNWYREKMETRLAKLGQETKALQSALSSSSSSSLPAPSSSLPSSSSSS